METSDISFIIPVYNRPQEIAELLQSFTELHGALNFEIVIIEDGSTISSSEVVESFSDKLNISYYFKDNSGPGDSRNYGMKRAKGSYFIILDSDCLLPPKYVEVVIENLSRNYTDCYGGPDAAHDSFTNLQKAINFSMTSFITTGGIRGKKGSVNKFEPRSFNMGISKKAFEDSGGFGKIHPGEDPDLSIRLEKLGFETQLIADAFVYHKRRISWQKFYKQVYKFGMVRPILNKWHPHTKKITYWFPLFFSLGLITALVLFFLGFSMLLKAYAFYFLLCLFLSLMNTRNIVVAIWSIPAVLIQFFGYGYGFLKAMLKLNSSNKSVEEVFPELFFK